MKCKFCGSKEFIENQVKINHIITNEKTYLCKKCKKLLPTSTLIDIYKKNGKYYNYPKCCIRQFIKDIKEGKSPARLRCGTKAGYIPCYDCLKNYEKKNWFPLRWYLIKAKSKTRFRKV